MADIKFMDISENDNPATTDSILIGNNDNGVKRTTLGKLSDMFSVHGLLHMEHVDTTVKAQTIQYPIQAPTVNGYQFAFWLSSASEGWVGSTYIDYLDSATEANIWISSPSSDGLGAFTNGKCFLRAIAVYIKSSVA